MTDRPNDAYRSLPLLAAADGVNETYGILLSICIYRVRVRVCINACWDYCGKHVSHAVSSRMEPYVCASAFWNCDPVPWSCGESPVCK